MGFKMNKPMFFGSREHKSALKQKRSYSMPAQGTDPGLVQAGRLLGESLMPGEMDFGIDYNPELKYPSDDPQSVILVDPEGNPVRNPITGCMDESAKNYNSAATVEGECVYDNEVGSTVISGCTDATATNYNANATNDDGSCVYATQINTNEDQGTVNVDQNAVNDQNVDQNVDQNANLNENTENREQFQAITIPPITNVSLLPNEMSTDLIQAGEYIAPQTNYAHENPNYENLKVPNNINFQHPEFENTITLNNLNTPEPSDPGYNFHTFIDPNTGEPGYILEYNGHEISIDDLPPDLYEAIAEEVINIQEDPTQSEIYKMQNRGVVTETTPEVNNNQEPVINNESNIVTVPNENQVNNVELMPIPPQSEDTTTPPVVTPKPVVRNPDFNMGEYKWNNGNGGWLPGGEKKYKEDKKRYKESKKGVNPIQARDNRIYNNAIPGGKVQMNMIKNGYVPN